jgi:hypothetical protein
MKNVYNLSTYKTIHQEVDGKTYSVEPCRLLAVPDEVALKIQTEWKEAQVTDVSESGEPWELKILPSLPPEFQNKIKFRTPERKVEAKVREVIEPAQPIDEAGKLGGQPNMHVCPRGCGFKSDKLKVVREHMLKCEPRPGE